MREPWRSRYLQAMGVDVYVARQSLPGAAAATVAEWDSAVLAGSGAAVEVAARDSAQQRTAAAPADYSAYPEVVTEAITTHEEHSAAPENTAANPSPGAAGPRLSSHPADTADTAEAASPRRSPLHDFDLATDAPTRASASAAASPIAGPAAPPSGDGSQAVSFSLVVARCGGVVIVDEIGAGEAGDFERLAANISRALGGTDATPCVDVFRWPLHRHPQLANDAAAARAALHGCLAQSLQQCNWLLVCGRAGEWADAALGEGLAAELSVRWATGDSLWECLRDGAAKRRLWQAIRDAASR